MGIDVQANLKLFIYYETVQTIRCKRHSSIPQKRTKL